jgi:WD40 repeat protein
MPAARPKKTAKKATKEPAAKKKTAKKAPAKPKKTAKKATKKPSAAPAQPDGKSPAFKPLDPWPLRDWPALAFVARSPAAARAFEPRATTSLHLRGELHYDDEPTLRGALAALDADAYVEFYGAADFTIDGLTIRVDREGELEADCTAIDRGFVGLTRPARRGHLVVHAGRSIGARGYLAGAYGPVAVLPELPPGAVQRFGDPPTREYGDARQHWVRRDLTWSFDQTGWHDFIARVRGPGGELLAERRLGRSALDVCDDGSAAILLTPDALEVVGPDLQPRCSWPVQRGVERIALSPDGALLMIIDDRGDRLEVRDALAGPVLWSLAGHFRDVGEFVRPDRLAVSGHARELTGDAAGLLLLDARTGRKLAFHPSERRIAQILPHGSGDIFHVLEDSQVAVFAAADGAPRGALTLVEPATDRLEPGDGATWRSSRDGARWHATTGLPLHDHRSVVRQLAVAGDTIASRDEHGLLILRDLAGRVRHRGVVQADPHLSLAPDGSRLVFTVDGALLSFEPATGAWSRSRALGAAAAVFLPDGRLVTGHKDGSLRVWPATLAAPETAATVGRRTIERLFVSPNGRWLLALGADFVARLVDARDLSVRCEIAGKRREHVAAVTDHGTVVLTTRDGATLHGPGGAPLAALSTAPVGAAAGDGAHLVVGAWRFLYVVDPATGERRGVLEGHEKPVGALAFAPGRLLSADDRLLVWDTAALDALEWTHPLDTEMVPLP